MDQNYIIFSMAVMSSGNNTILALERFQQRVPRFFLDFSGLIFNVKKLFYPCS